MVLKSSGEVIGDCGLTRQTVDGVDEIEIGYHVRRDLWGRGLAPEAAGACRDYGFEKGARRLISLTEHGQSFPGVLDKRIGQHISGLMRSGGDIEWSLGRKRGLGL